jgi:hypothetical protein
MKDLQYAAFPDHENGFDQLTTKTYRRLWQRLPALLWKKVRMKRRGRKWNIF